MRAEIKLGVLMESWKDCESCDLSKARKNVVSFRGSSSARVFLIGEAPGADEDETGTPFTGEAGKLLDALLGEASYNPEDYIISNMVACRPPNNRTPKAGELRECSPRLQYALAAVNPKVLVLLGGTAAKLAGIRSITSWRGEPVDVEMLLWNGTEAYWPAIPTFHPSYLLRQGNDAKIRRQMVRDLRKALEMSHAS